MQSENRKNFYKNAITLTSSDFYMQPLHQKPQSTKNTMKGNDAEKEIAMTLLNGLYMSSNPNLHKYRDYDPFLSNHVNKNRGIRMDLLFTYVLKICFSMRKLYLNIIRNSICRYRYSAWTCVRPSARLITWP